MSTMLATTNPDAAAESGRKIDMPAPGTLVMYHFREGERFGGVRETPALVMARDTSNGELRLLVIKNHDDLGIEERVPRKRPHERGWEYVEGGAVGGGDTAKLIEALGARVDKVNERLENFMGELSEVFFGEQPKPETALLDQFAALVARVEKLEKPARRPRNPSES